MATEIIVALISALVTVGNVVFTSLMSQHSEKKRIETVKTLKQDNRIELLEQGVQSLLRADILHSHEKYMHKGFCPVYAREALTHAYDAYHQLGGNGTITTLYNQIMNLPLKEDEEDEN